LKIESKIDSKENQNANISNPNIFNVY